MKICRVKYYVDFRSILDSKRAYAPLPWNHLEHEALIARGFLSREVETRLR
jgi:hypothetical protein